MDNLQHVPTAEKEPFTKSRTGCVECKRKKIKVGLPSFRHLLNFIEFDVARSVMRRSPSARDVDDIPIFAGMS
jgi:hypothetical protein